MGSKYILTFLLLFSWCFSGQLLAQCKPDFSYKQDICNPKSVQFFAIPINGTSYFWDFGNTQTISGNTSPTITFNSFGTYNVKLKVTNASNCTDSITKAISITVLQENLISQNDASICAGSSFAVNITDTGLNHCWTPTTGIANINSNATTITPLATTTYYYTTQSLGNNLVVNGNFSAGNTGFQSDYVSNFPNTAAAQYWVGSNPNSWWPDFPNCQDRNGNGIMMMVNGATVIGQRVWYQTISVTPNTNYAFSIWLSSIHPASPANLKFSINNSILGDNIVASSSTCLWRNFYATWNSGNSTTAIISIVNNNNAFSGNDFALDDIFFGQVLVKQDSLKLTVIPKPVITTSPSSATICAQDSVQLSVTGASNVSWSPSAGLSNASISNPKASPVNNTTYTVTAFNTPGCSNTTNVTVTVTPRPVLTVSPSSATICAQDSVQLSATGASNISWTPSTGLNNASITNPKASPNNTTTYTVTGYNVVGCSNTANVTVSVVPKPIISVNALAVTKCQSDSAQLIASGATNISWSPSVGLSNASIANPMAAPNTNTVYTATGYNTVGCSGTANISFNVLSLPTLSVSAAATICRDSVVQLNATATAGASYSWVPTTNLNSAVIANPLASPTSTTKYKVTATGINGCTKTDSILVTVLEKPTLQLRSDTSVCSNTALSITANSGGANSFSWQPTTYLSNPNILNPVIIPMQPTQYIVTAGNGICTAKDTFNLGVLPLPTLTKSLDTTICKTGKAILTASTSTGNFTWSPSVGVTSSNINSITVSPDTTRYYYINATAANSCTNKDSIKVTVNPKPTISVTPATATVCNGDSVLLSAMGGDNYLWFNGTGIVNTGASSTIIKPTSTATYKVVITNNTCKSKDTLSIPILLNPLPSTSITKSNDINCSLSTATIIARGGTNYVWSGAADINNSTSATLVVSPTQTTVYKVKITNAAGCSKYDSIKVQVTTAGAANNKYLLPTAFTPNNDGLNDCFGLKFWGAITELDFKVYNRFGQIVFQTTNPSACWDGKQNGIEADLGTYIYQIKAKTICNGEVYRKGTLILLR